MDLRKLIFISLIILSLIIVTSDKSCKTSEIEISKVNATIKVPAIYDNKTGLITWLTVESVPGSGRVLIDSDSALFFIDTQNSIKRARDVAKNITDKKIDDIDLIYSISPKQDQIEGISGGAAFTIATIAVIKNLTIDENVTITGSVLSNGTIGRVWWIGEKALISNDFGITKFLVPKGQSSNLSIDDIEIIEVENIEESLKYFIK